MWMYGYSYYQIEWSEEAVRYVGYAFYIQKLVKAMSYSVE